VATLIKQGSINQRTMINNSITKEMATGNLEGEELIIQRGDQIIIIKTGDKIITTKISRSQDNNIMSRLKSTKSQLKKSITQKKSRNNLKVKN